MSQAIGTLGSLTVLGVEMTLSRGVSPSSGLVRLLPATTFDRFVDDLTFTSPGVSRTFTDMAVADVSQRNFDGRDGWRWNAVVQDNRWKWRYPRISGEYNRRLCDGTVDTKGKKNAKELGELLATELGGNIDVSALPTNVYPPIRWEDAIARFELAWLCDLFALSVCPKTDNTFVLEPLMQAASLPAGGVNISPSVFSFKPAIMPSRLEVRGGGKDRKQGWVPLQAIGLDTDGKYKLIDNLSYSPGWDTQWPHVFPDVAIADRYLAFQTVFRLYAPTDPSIILDDHVLETGLDVPADRKRCLPPQLRGVFFCHDDFGTTTSPTAIYSGKFRIRKDINAVELSYPAYTLSGGTVSPAQLQINTAYYTVDSNGNPSTTYSKDKPVSGSQRTTKPRVLRHPELNEREILDAIYGGAAGSNTAALDSESQMYLDSVELGYNYDKAQDVLYAGILNIDLSGSISQIAYKVGNGRIASTRVGVNHEFDVTTMHNQQRRAQERLSQIAERMGV